MRVSVKSLEGQIDQLADRVQILADFLEFERIEDFDQKFRKWLDGLEGRAAQNSLSEAHQHRKLEETLFDEYQRQQEAQRERRVRTRVGLVRSTAERLRTWII